MTEYVVGFLFSMNRKKVVLIEKQKPLWQKGLWNGVGGKIEKGEKPYQAMRREFREETGLYLQTWHEMLVMSGEDWKVHVFANVNNKIDMVKTMETEVVQIFDVDKLPNVISNLRWIIPFLIDKPEYKIELKTDN